MMTRGEALLNAETTSFALGSLPGDLDVPDPGIARALSAPLDQLFHQGRRSFGDDFDAAVGQVSYPAAETQRVGLDGRRVPESHALDPTADQQSGAFGRRLGHVRRQSNAPWFLGFLLRMRKGSRTVGDGLVPSRIAVPQGGRPQGSVRDLFEVGALVYAAMAATASAGELPRAEPEAVGMTKEGLNAVAEAMDRMVADGELVGMNAMIARRGQVVFEHATGTLDLETGAPMRADSLIRIYSMTKPITSAAALMLVDDGKLDLDEPVTKFFPEWNDQTAYEGDKVVPVDPPVTATHLLQHTSGLSYGYVGNTPVDKAYREAGLIDDWDYLVRDTNILVQKLADIPLLFQPGTRWHYSFSTDVLGQLIERVSGQPLDQYFDERLFGPLGMEDVYFDVPPDVVHRFGTDHEFKDGNFVVQDNPREDPEFIGVTFLSGGGGLVMPTESYVRFCQMILNGGELDGTRVLEPETVALMTTDQLPEGIWPSGGFGLGFAVVTEPGGSTPVGSYSWGGAAGTFFWIDPGNELVGVFMPQFIGMPNSIQEKLKGLVYAAMAP